MAFTRTASGVCVANLHATNDMPDLAAEDVLRAAGGGDRVGRRGAAALRRRPQPAPGREPGDLRRAARSASASPAPTAPDAIDHLLVRGLETLEPPTRWPPERREVECDGLALRLSDHAPVEADFEHPEPPCADDDSQLADPRQPRHRRRARWPRKKRNPAKRRKKPKKPRPAKKRKPKAKAKAKAKAQSRKRKKAAATSGLDKSVEQFRESLEQSVTLSRDRLQEVVDDAVKRGRMTAATPRRCSPTWSRRAAARPTAC